MKKSAQGELLMEAELKDLLLQVAMGLKFIHSYSLVHLDIKPSLFRLLLSSYWALQPSCSPTLQFSLYIQPSCLLKLLLSPLGNIFICQQASAATGRDSEGEDEEYSSARVLYKIGI